MTSPRSTVEGEPPKIPGAGPALAAKLAELSETGHLEYYERLRAQVPDGLLEMLRVPGVGPRTVRLLHDELGIDSVEGLRAAAEAGRLRGVKGLSARTEQNILAGIGRIERRSTDTRLLLHDADALVGGLIDALRDVPRRAAHLAGRVAAPAASRRSATSTSWRRSTIRRRSSRALDGLPEVEQVLSAGTDKSSIVLRDGPQVDLMVCPPRRGARTSCTSPAARSTTSRCVAWPSTAAGRCPRRASRSSRTARCSMPPRRRSLRAPRACRGSRRRCARPTARSRPRSRAACRRSSATTTCEATRTRTRTGPMASTRSR